MPQPEPTKSTTPMFGGAEQERTKPGRTVWAIAGVAAVLLIAVLMMMKVRGPVAKGPIKPVNQVLPLAAYAPNLEMSGVVMSEATSLSGGKSTYIDGHVSNKGSATVTSVTVQVLFKNDEAMPPQVVTLPLALIRTRQPYVDTQPVSADPIAPGTEREFRLIFENIGSNWNQQVPEIRVVAVNTR